MKKFLVCMGILLSANFYAQIQKGSVLIGPSISYSQSKSTTTQQGSSYSAVSKQSQFSGTLRLGYFITDNIAVGVLGGSTNSHNHTTNSNYPNEYQDTKTGIYNVGVFGRMYKMYNENKFGFFGQLDLVYLSGNTTTSSIDNNGVYSEGKADITGFSAAVRPGVVYFITKKIGLEAMFGNLAFQRQTQKDISNGLSTSSTTSNNFNLNFALSSLYLGVNFYLGK